ncbi:MAG: hypothetical protein LBQ24_01130 [Candidatus Peribacteria bacterium]|jgi:hypothetical protein|nr:hypothetical protein [Candidatus Peribacteria bacterium]
MIKFLSIVKKTIFFSSSSISIEDTLYISSGYLTESILNKASSGFKLISLISFENTIATSLAQTEYALST